MQSTELYRQILGFDHNWSVVDLNAEEKKVSIEISLIGKQLHCSECAKASPRYDRGILKKWRHLDICQMQSLISCSPPRVQCSGME